MILSVDRCRHMARNRWTEYNFFAFEMSFFRRKHGLNAEHTVSVETRSIKIFALRRKAAVIPDSMSVGPEIQTHVVQWPVSVEIAHIAAAVLHRKTVCTFLRKQPWIG